MKLIRMVVYGSFLLVLEACVTGLPETTIPGNGVVLALQKHLPQLNESADDPALYDAIFPFDSVFGFRLSEPLWVVPSAQLPLDVRPQKSNNNVSIAVFNQRLYLAFRTGPTHFASEKTGMYIISTANGVDWRKELEFFEGRDYREPFLMVVNGVLHFYCFAAGTKMTAFEPEFIRYYTTTGHGDWAGPTPVLEQGEVHWEMKKRGGKYWLTSYTGSHYALRGESKVGLHLKHSTDGKNWTPLGSSGQVYLGGVSETAFEFDRTGNLWGVTRNEDGDATGFGSHVIFALADSLGKWQFPKHTDARCFMSPKMFRHGNDLYLIARFQLGKKPFQRASQSRSMRHQRLVNWVGFSLSPKTTAIYRINQANREVHEVMRLPGAGDTAFPSIIRLGRDRFLVANYSSNPLHAHRNWLNGQLGQTGIYLQLIEFDTVK